MNLELVRHAYLDDMTLGALKTPDFRLATIERPWLQNPDGPGGMVSESCVPDGPYQLIPHDSERFPDTYALIAHYLGVYYQGRPEGQEWGRTAILIHIGNRVEDVEGCIAVGMSHGRLEGERVVLRSRGAMDRLRELLGRENHQLRIRPTKGTEE